MNGEIIVYVSGFIVLYIILYVILGFFFKDSSTEDFDRILSRTIDLFITFLLLIIGLTIYYSVSSSQWDSFGNNFFKQFIGFLENSWSLLYLGMVLIIIYSVIYMFRVPMSSNLKPFTIGIIETITWLLFSIVLFEVTIRALLKIDLIQEITNFFNGFFAPNYSNQTQKQTPKDDDDYSTVVNMKGNATPTSSPHSTDEVFNIAGNHFTYEDAQTICSAYGANIATYDQIEDAYNDGAEWCNYGWSDKQMAFFPTQKSTWDKLQKNPSTANNCGRPGVNGGYMANPHLRFGVNCFGKKPKMKPEDVIAMQSYQNTINAPIPLTEEEAEMNEKMKFWKENAAKLLNVNSFNQTKWSEY